MTLTTGHPGPAAPAVPRTEARADPPRPRRGSGVLLLPPWRRAPLLPFGQPAVILAVVAATAILACAAASAALFLSSAASASVQRLIAADCPDAATAAIKHGAPVRELPALRPRMTAALTGAGLAAPNLTVRADAFTVVGRPGQDPIAKPLFRVVHRAEALDHVTPLPGAVGGRGVWLSQYTGERLGVPPGGTVEVGGRPVRVAGYYRNFWDQPLDPYWCSYQLMVLNLQLADDVPPPLVLATDPEVFGELAGAGTATYWWVSPVDPAGITESRARDLGERQTAAYAAAGLPEPADFGLRNGGPGQLAALSDRAGLIREGLRGPVVPIALGGSLLALLLVGAAGSYWADRRAREVRLLTSRGVGPGALAAKAVLELAVPAVVGTLLGWQLARWLVTALGPSPDLDAAAPGRAALIAGVGLVAGLALLGLVAGLRARNATERPVGARRSRLALVPWELALLAGAAATFAALRDGRAVRVVENVAQVNLLVVLFPLLFILGASVLVVRLLVLVLPRLARRAGRLSPAWYLAARRLTAARVASVVLLAAAATPVALGAYAAGLTAGSAATLTAKARLFTGAEVSVNSTDTLARTPATDAAGTIVRRYSYGTVGGSEVAVLAVDPESLGRTAYWRPEFAGRSLADLLATLAGPAADGRVPAVVVDPRGELDRTADVRLGTSTVRVAEAATAAYFPGRRLPYPMIVVDQGRLGEVDPRAGSRDELWTNGPAAPAQAAVLDQDKLIFTTVDQARIFQAADYLGITWTFGYLAALAALVGLVAVGALLLYLETRQRSRTASYALGRRMGLGRATHFRSLLAELGLLLGLAYATGLALGVVALGLVHGLLEVDPSRPPAPLLVVPVAALLGAAAAVALVVALSALYAQRAADRTSPASVLRLG